MTLIINISGIEKEFNKRDDGLIMPTQRPKYSNIETKPIKTGHFLLFRNNYFQKVQLA